MDLMSEGSAAINQFAKFFRTSIVNFEETAAFVGGFVILCFILLTLTRMTGETILTPFLWSALVVTILQPLCDKLHKQLYKFGVSAECWIPPRALCAALVLLAFLALLCLWSYISFQEAKIVMANERFYKLGFDEAERALGKELKSFVEYRFPNIGKNAEWISYWFTGQVVQSAHDKFELYTAELKERASHILGQFFFAFLYIVFWLFSEPTGMMERSSNILRKFLFFKAIVGALYSIFIYFFMKYYACIDTPWTMATINFCCSFIPSVGSLIASLCPVPLIICDSRQEKPAKTVLMVVVIQALTSFLFNGIGNLLFYRFSMDKHFRIHPVVILFSLGLFGFMLGASGMLLAVPILAYLKAMAYSGDLPRVYRDFVLVSLEGDFSAISRCEDLARDDKSFAASEVSRNDGYVEVPGGPVPNRADPHLMNQNSDDAPKLDEADTLDVT